MSNYDTEYDYDDIPWDEIPNGNYLPASIVLAELEMLSDEIASSGKRMFVANFKIIEPEDFYGRKHTERYVVSTDEFPQKFDATTIGAVGLKQMRMAAQMQPMKASELCEYAETVRPQLMFQLREPKPTDDFQHNSIVKYFTVGEREPEILQNTVVTKGNKPLAQRATPPRHNKAFSQTSAPAQQAQKQQQKHVVSRSAPATQRQNRQQPPEPDPDDLVPLDDYGTDDEISYNQPAQTDGHIATAIKTQPQEVMITCPKCHEEIPSSQMGQHMADHFRQ
jgi:hypothetical protein